MKSNKIELNEKEQAELLAYIGLSLKQYETQSKDYREQLFQVYLALSTFEMPDTWDVLTRFKINKAHEIVRKVVPRIIANPPKMIVTPRTDIFEKWDEKNNIPGTPERQKMLDKHNKYAMATQEYLNAVYNDQNFRERLKVWVVNQITYGNAFADVVWRYKIQKSKDKAGKISETVVGVMPSIDILSWTEIFYDARFKFLEDMPWIIRRRRGVRLLDLYSDDKYFNLDKIEGLHGSKYIDADQYSNLIFEVSWVQWVQCGEAIDKNSLSLEESQIRYSITGKAIHEKLYKVTTVNQAIIIGLEEITDISIVDIKWHEDPETANSVGLVAPILGITDELNFQKNAQATAISKQLNRSYLWSPESGVDPSTLISDRPGNIIYCADGVDMAEKHLKEQANRELPAQYFANINDYNRDIQSLTHTTDVSQPGGQTALTNTATGARISFFESNSVIAEFRKNFERWVVELSYKILDWAANNIEKDIVLKKANSKEFLKININAIKESLNRYDIVVEANSSSFDNIENRRADAIARKNLMIEAANAGVNIDLNEWFRSVFSTFEQVDIDKLMPAVDKWADIDKLLWWGGGWNIPAGKNAPKPKWPTTPAELTSAVAWGTDLLSNV